MLEKCVLTVLELNWNKRLGHKKTKLNICHHIDPFHKWLPIINSFVIIKISLTNLVFELTIQKNFYSQTRLVRLILIITKEFIIGSHL